MSAHQTTERSGTRRILTRRDLLKTSGAVAAAGAAAVVLPKASRSFAAPAVLQGETINLRYMTWFWWEPGRQDAWRFMVEKFHGAQNEIRIEETGWPFNEFTNNIIVQLQAGEIEGDLIQTTPDLGRVRKPPEALGFAAWKRAT